jgi:hypothetical protein
MVVPIISATRELEIVGICQCGKKKLVRPYLNHQVGYGGTTLVISATGQA